jgi:hypothetical protein
MAVVWVKSLTMSCIKRCVDVPLWRRAVIIIMWELGWHSPRLHHIKHILWWWVGCSTCLMLYRRLCRHKLWTSFETWQGFLSLHSYTLQRRKVCQGGNTHWQKTHSTEHNTLRSPPDILHVVHLTRRWPSARTTLTENKPGEYRRTLSAWSGYATPARAHSLYIHYSLFITFYSPWGPHRP